MRSRHTNGEKHHLLDLPGTLSGLDEHDAEAAAGVRRADLLLIVTTVELPGEAEMEQITNLLDAEGFARRALVVVNKANSEDSDRNVVQAQIEGRLADFPDVGVYFVDARDYTQALTFPGMLDEDRERLRDASRVQHLEDALSALVERVGDYARLHAATHEVRRVCEEAVLRWHPNNEEESLELTAARISQAFASARAELFDSTEVSLETYRNDVTGIGAVLAAAVSEEDGSITERAATNAEEAEAQAAQRYQASVSDLVTTTVETLADQLGLAASDWAHYAGAAHAASPEEFLAKPSDSSRRDELTDRLVDTAVNAIKGKLDAFLKGGVDAGSPMHDLAKKIN